MGDDGSVDDTPPGDPWAPPGARGEAGAAPGPPDPARDLAGGSAAGTADPPPAVPTVALRPMTVADVLDGGFAVLKARPLRILGMTAALVVPVNVLLGLVFRDSMESTGFELWTEDPTVAGEMGQTSGSSPLATLLLYVLSGLVLVAVTAAITHLVVSWAGGHDPSSRELGASAARHWWPLLASFLVVSLATLAAALLCVVPVLFVGPLFVATTPAVAAEGVGPLVAVGRSTSLVTRRYWPVMGTTLLLGIVAVIVSIVLSFVPTALGELLFGVAPWPLLVLGQIASHIVVVPFVGAASALLYLDLRVRTEGLDIELDAVDLLPRVA